MGRSSSVLEGGLILSPLVALVLLITWFSKYTISEGPNINASLVNPLGFLISNFVFDGFLNVENIVLSCVFLSMIFLYYPKFLKIRSAFLLPLFALISGAATELAAEITCRGSCSFYGMSGIAGGVIGFTLANFLIVIIATFFSKNTRVEIIKEMKVKDKLSRYSVIPLLAVYVVLLLALSGFFAIHPTATNPFPVTVQVPVSIASESQSIQVGHSSGIAIGFLLYLLLFLYLAKRANLASSQEERKDGLSESKNFSRS